MAVHDPLAALRQRNFKIYAASLFVYGISTTLLPAVIALQVYDITGSATKLGIIGLVWLVVEGLSVGTRGWNWGLLEGIFGEIAGQPCPQAARGTVASG